MGTTQSRHNLRPPELSFNPLLAAQALKRSRAEKRVDEGARRQTPWSLFAQMAVQYLLARKWLAAEDLAPVQQHGRWCIAVLSFLYAAARQRYLSRPRDEAESSSSLEEKPRKLGRRGSSKFRGLSWHKTVGKWAVQLRINGQVRRSLIPDLPLCTQPVLL